MISPQQGQRWCHLAHPSAEPSTGVGGGAGALVLEEVDGLTTSIVHEPQRVWPLRRGEEEEQQERLEAWRRGSSTTMMVVRGVG
jgi:hypothetical protein